MIVVRVELHSAITGKVLELARMHIANRGTGTESRGNYDGTVLRGRSRDQLDRAVTQKRGEVLNYPRQQIHVWNLIARMLGNMGYG